MCGLAPQDKPHGQHCLQATPNVQQNAVVDAMTAFASFAANLLGKGTPDPHIHIFGKSPSRESLAASHSAPLALQDGKPSNAQPTAQAQATQQAQQAQELAQQVQLPPQKEASTPLTLDNDNGQEGTKTHEDFEAEALQKLMNRKEKKGAVQTRGLKRPASAKTKPPAKAAKVKAKAKAKSKATPEPQSGCSKCKGQGCGQCRNPDFKGKRYSRQQWLTLSKLQNLK